MIKMKNSIIYIGVCIIIFASFKMPEILFEVENYSVESKVYKRQENKNEIDVEAEKIYLVKAIHTIERENNMALISSSGAEEYSIKGTINENGEFTNTVVQEFFKLTDYNILASFEKSVNTKVAMEVVEKGYQKQDSRYIMNNITLELDDQYYGIEVENKTGKILFINFEKEKLNHNISKEEIMRNYIKYLDLYIIDDWKFENDRLKSEKAELAVNLIENEYRYILSIHTMGYTYKVN